MNVEDEQEWEEVWRRRRLKNTRSAVQTESMIHFRGCSHSPESCNYAEKESTQKELAAKKEREFYHRDE